MRGWRVAIILAAAVIVATAALSEWTAPAARNAGGGTDAIGETYFPPGQRDSAPAISGPTLVGPRYALIESRGRVTVVNVWASWCEQCRKESRGLGHLSAALSARAVQFVGIDEHDTDQKGRSFATASGTLYPQLVDPRGTLLAKLRLLPSLGIPSTLVIDPDGRMAGRIIGAADETVLRTLIERVATDH